MRVIDPMEQGAITLLEKVTEAAHRLNTKLEDLGNGSIEIEKVDEESGIVKITLLGGRLI